ncbi:MAG: MoaD/ThiS family protein [Anaerolineales bacterium]|jgi:molybdopterin converting factor small subunit
MIVRLRLFGVLENYLGGKKVEIQLPEAATLRQLWDAIDIRFGDSLPAEYWDRERKRFQRAVTVMISDVEVEDDMHPLSDQQEIFLLPPMIGG